MILIYLSKLLLFLLFLLKLWKYKFKSNINKNLDIFKQNNFNLLFINNQLKNQNITQSLTLLFILTYFSVELSFESFELYIIIDTDLFVYFNSNNY